MADRIFRHGGGETLVVFKHDEPAGGDVDVTTISHRAVRPLAGLSVDYEAALQGGKTAGKNQQAWADPPWGF